MNKNSTTNTQANSQIGAKTLKLSDLVALGLNVPKFKAIDAHELSENFNNLEPLATKLHAELNCSRYAVRSSALIEDSQTESFAGQFKTKINVDPSDLASAISEITTHAKQFLGGSIDKFSVLIQEYIEPNMSGVTFTRNPTGGREMIIESHKGRGEDLVSGNIKPKTQKLYWSDPSPKNTPTHHFKKIEEFYKFPQDIEWCVKGKKWYFLQTRPITTISKTEYEQSLYLDKNLPFGDFFYEKTEISEIAPRPTQITQDILSKVYEEGGPIQQAYKKFKINYKPAEIIKIVGNELFVDREAELKTLLPSYSYLKSKDLTFRISTLSGIFRTIGNFWNLCRINLDKYDEISQSLNAALENKHTPKTIPDFLKLFEKDYQIIFEINLLAGISIKKIEPLVGALSKNKISLSLLLSQGHYLFTEDELPTQPDLDTSHLRGNTIEVSDESEFARNLQDKINKDPEHSEVTEWWGKLSEIKKNMLKQKIQNAVIYNRLREMSRWLVVKRISQLRELLPKEKDIYFAKLSEITNNTHSPATSTKRKAEYDKYADFNMPTTLTNKSTTPKQSTQGVSPGKAEGVLVTAAELTANAHHTTPNQDKILLTQVLSPELTEHFDKIKGIVSEQGGFLSHLSIIARERGLPVITGVPIAKLTPGTKVEINGETGELST